MSTQPKEAAEARAAYFQMIEKQNEVLSLEVESSKNSLLEAEERIRALEEEAQRYNNQIVALQTQINQRASDQNIYDNDNNQGNHNNNQNVINNNKNDKYSSSNNGNSNSEHNNNNSNNSNSDKIDQVNVLRHDKFLDSLSSAVDSLQRENNFFHFLFSALLSDHFFQQLDNTHNNNDSIHHHNLNTIRAEDKQYAEKLLIFLKETLHLESFFVNFKNSHSASNKSKQKKSSKEQENFIGLEKDRIIFYSDHLTKLYEAFQLTNNNNNQKQIKQTPTAIQIKKIIQAKLLFIADLFNSLFSTNLQLHSNNTQDTTNDNNKNKNEANKGTNNNVTNNNNGLNKLNYQETLNKSAKASSGEIVPTNNLSGPGSLPIPLSNSLASASASASVIIPPVNSTHSPLTQSSVSIPSLPSSQVFPSVGCLNYCFHRISSSGDPSPFTACLYGHLFLQSQTVLFANARNQVQAQTSFNNNNPDNKNNNNNIDHSSPQFLAQLNESIEVAAIQLFQQQLLKTDINELLFELRQRVFDHILKNVLQLQIPIAVALMAHAKALKEDQVKLPPQSNLVNLIYPFVQSLSDSNSPSQAPAPSLDICAQYIKICIAENHPFAPSLLLKVIPSILKVPINLYRDVGTLVGYSCPIPHAVYGIENSILDNENTNNNNNPIRLVFRPNSNSFDLLVNRTHSHPIPSSNNNPPSSPSTGSSLSTESNSNPSQAKSSLSAAGSLGVLLPQRSSSSPSDISYVSPNDNSSILVSKSTSPMDNPKTSPYSAKKKVLGRKNENFPPKFHRQRSDSPNNRGTAGGAPANPAKGRSGSPTRTSGDLERDREDRVNEKGSDNSSPEINYDNPTPEPGGNPFLTAPQMRLARERSLYAEREARDRRYSAEARDEANAPDAFQLRQMESERLRDEFENGPIAGRYHSTGSISNNSVHDRFNSISTPVFSHVAARSSVSSNEGNLNDSPPILPLVSTSPPLSVTIPLGNNLPSSILLSSASALTTPSNSGNSNLLISSPIQHGRTPRTGRRSLLPQSGSSSPLTNLSTRSSISVSAHNPTSSHGLLSDRLDDAILANAKHAAVKALNLSSSNGSPSSEGLHYSDPAGSLANELLIEKLSLNTISSNNNQKEILNTNERAISSGPESSYSSTAIKGQVSEPLTLSFNDGNNSNKSPENESINKSESVTNTFRRKPVVPITGNNVFQGSESQSVNDLGIVDRPVEVEKTVMVTLMFRSIPHVREWPLSVQPINHFMNLFEKDLGAQPGGLTYFKGDAAVNRESRTVDVLKGLTNPVFNVTTNSLNLATSPVHFKTVPVPVFKHKN